MLVACGAIISHLCGQHRQKRSGDRRAAYVTRSRFRVCGAIKSGPSKQTSDLSKHSVPLDALSAKCISSLVHSRRASASCNAACCLRTEVATNCIPVCGPEGGATSLTRGPNLCYQHRSHKPTDDSCKLMQAPLVYFRPSALSHGGISRLQVWISLGALGCVIYFLRCAPMTKFNFL